MVIRLPSASSTNGPLLSTASGWQSGCTQRESSSAAPQNAAQARTDAARTARVTGRTIELLFMIISFLLRSI